MKLQVSQYKKDNAQLQKVIKDSELEKEALIEKFELFG
jgi:hypothetical protein